MNKNNDNINIEQYKVDFSYFKKKRPNGVSGILRVKNDAEFLEASVESCISALDELIIVYNDCTDQSPEIIKRMQEKYPNKIHSFEYPTKIYSVGLSKEEYEFAIKLPEDSEHLLANYYNFALSKASYKYAMKIDADQIYFTESLTELLDAYRGTLKTTLQIKHIFSFLIILTNLIINKLFPKAKISFDYKKHFAGYKSYLLLLVKYFKLPVSLSGINVFYNKEWFVTIGDINENLNILPPYNGEGDHIVFKITNKTKYKPYIQPSYCLMTSTNYSLIEKFEGISLALPYGFMWFHMNCMRRKIFERQIINFKANPAKFSKLIYFFNLPFQQIISEIPTILFSNRSKNLFNILHEGDLYTVPNELLKSYSYTVELGLKKD